MCRWREIESHLDDPAPFIFAASRTTLREIPLERADACCFVSALKPMVPDVIAAPVCRAPSRRSDGGGAPCIR